VDGIAVNAGGIGAIAAGLAVAVLATAAFVYKLRKAQQAAQAAKKMAAKTTPSPLQTVRSNGAVVGAVASIRPPVPTNAIRINPTTGLGAQPARSAMQSVRAGAGAGPTNQRQTFVNVAALEAYNRHADMKSFQATQARNMRAVRSTSTQGTPRKATRLTGVGIDL
jgi:hypothetical protein